MKVTQEKLSASQIALDIEIPADQSKQVYEKVIRELSRSIRLPGFRKGKVPRPILLQRVGVSRIKAEALDQLIQDCLEKAIKQESLEVIGNYQLRSQIDDLISQFTPGEALTFSISMDVPPETKLGDYKGISVKAEEIKYNPKDVDEFLDNQRAKRATLVPVEGREVQKGDVVLADYQGFLKDENGGKGEAIEGAEANDFELEVEADKFISDLVEGIVGMNVEETKEISVTFPEDYAREDLAGAEALFIVTVHEIKEKELPELDDEFAEEASEFETMAELREHLEKQYQEQAEAATKGNIEAAIQEQLIEVTDIELPESMLDREIDLLIQESMIEMRRYGMDVDKMMTPEMKQRLRPTLLPEAKQRLTVSLALQELTEIENLEIDQEAIEKRLTQLLESLDRQKIDMDRLRNYVEEEIKEQTALDWLRENVTVELVPEGTLKQEEEEAAAAEAEEEIPEQVDVKAETVEDDSEE